MMRTKQAPPPSSDLASAIAVLLSINGLADQEDSALGEAKIPIDMTCNCILSWLISQGTENIGTGRRLVCRSECRADEETIILLFGSECSFRTYVVSCLFRKGESSGTLSYTVMTTVQSNSLCLELLRKLNLLFLKTNHTQTIKPYHWQVYVSETCS